TPNRPLPEALSHPALTGMSRRQLGDLVERLAVRQAALVERRRYTQRGGERMPGGRGGIFLQKITDAERVLATVLHLRQLCTRAVLAELFHVSPRTIGNALLDVRPLLEQDGYTPAPAPTRYRTATALLAAIPQQEDDTTESTH
ncbi:ISAzo13 family transposase, partial [Rhodococcus koreensis]